VDNPTYDEAIYMAKIKRQRAKAALNHHREQLGIWPR
jgi:hypothetical protein